jgi:hypothetical protein
MARSAFDPATLEDPVALATAWTPCKPGGASFCTHVLKPGTATRLAFRPTVGACLFYAAFLGPGLFLLLLIPLVASHPGTTSGGIAAGFVFGCLFGGLGAYMMWSGTRPIVFDLDRGMFWKGWSPAAGPGRASIELARVHALQVITERCTGKNSSYYSYELNLVLDDGSRINVVDHGNLGRVLRDGAAVAAFLDVPFWNP